MRISDWSSDVCSSDFCLFDRADACALVLLYEAEADLVAALEAAQLGRAFGRKCHRHRWPAEPRHRAMAQGNGACGDLLDGAVCAVLLTPLPLRLLSVAAGSRSAARRVGKECVSTFSTRCSPYP